MKKLDKQNHKHNLFWAERGKNVLDKNFVCFWGPRPYTGGVLFEFTFAQASRMGLTGLKPGAGCYVKLSVLRTKP